MSFDYDAIRIKKNLSGTQWAAYSDLFMVLAFIFLLMYMVSSLRAGMSSISTHAQIEEVKQEMQLYESIKNDYIEGQANSKEREIYQALLDQVSLLETQANKSKKQHEKQYNEQKVRESSLNDYQRMIMTMISANTIAKSSAAQKIALEKEQNLQLESTVEQQIKELSYLDNKIQAEKAERDELASRHKNEKSTLEAKFQEIKEKHEDDQYNLASLEAMLKVQEAEKSSLKNAHEEQTRNLERKFVSLKKKQEEKQDELSNLETKLKKEEEEKQELAKKYKENRSTLEKEYAKLEDKRSEDIEKVANLQSKIKMQEAEKSALKNAYSEVTKNMENKLQTLEGKHSKNQEKLAFIAEEAKDQVNKLNSDLDNTKQTLKDTTQNLDKANKDLVAKSRDLTKALKMAQRRKDIAKRIRDNFKKNGINAQVDDETGDVILNFGENYFDTDSHRLKPAMESTIRKAIPLYALSLFGSKSLAEKISSVEIIGFSSPTYAGKLIDPTTLSEADKVAVNYNLDLSYRRARSIFDYIFDTQKIQFDHQETMVHLINVTGRSFFAEKIDHKDSDGLSVDEFCDQYNCKKSQRVIIKFGLDDKGDHS